MASGQKKKTTGKARQGGGQSRQTSRSPQKNPRPPIRREVGGGVCLLLALCVVVSYFQADAIVLNLLGDLLKGLTGYGYWLAAPALALAGVNLLAHRGRPVALRTVCTLVTPVLLGAILHLFLYQGETVTGLGPMMKSLWADGLLLKSGGAVAGGLAAGMKRLVGTMVSVIVLLLLLAAALLAALRVSPRELVQRARDRVPYEPQPEPERPARPERPRRQRPSVDVPLDDAPAPREKTADRRSEPPEEPLPRKKGKGFFARKGDDGAGACGRAGADTGPGTGPGACAGEEVPPGAGCRPGGGAACPGGGTGHRGGAGGAGGGVSVSPGDAAGPEYRRQLYRGGGGAAEQLPPPGPDHHQLRRGCQARRRGPRTQRHPV